MAKIHSTTARRNSRVAGQGAAGPADLPGVWDTRAALIQALLPLGVEAACEMLRDEVTELVGAPYDRQRPRPALVRLGRQVGSVYVSDHKVRLPVPRVRDRQTRQEVRLATYARLQQPQAANTRLFGLVLQGLACRRYERAAGLVPAVFGLSPSTVSRRFIQASAQRLRTFQERRLDAYDLVAVVLDGKTFAADLMVVALGITLTGEKIPLGFVETSTENARVCTQFLRQLVERGLRPAPGLLWIIDGAKGLRAALRTVCGPLVVVQRCQWHKRENVVAYLPKPQQAAMRRQLQQAYEQPTYEGARAALRRCRHTLARINQSAVASLDEGLEETLTLHRLGVFPALGRSLKTTNCLESVNGQIQRCIGRVTHWRTSDQKHRWLASALLEIEPRLRRIKGYRALPQLRAALQQPLHQQTDQAA